MKMSRMKTLSPRWLVLGENHFSEAETEIWKPVGLLISVHVIKNGRITSKQFITGTSELCVED